MDFADLSPARCSPVAAHNQLIRLNLPIFVSADLPSIAAAAHKGRRRYLLQLVQGGTPFISACLSAPTMRMQTFIGGGAACSDFLQAVADLIGILVPTMERQGITTAAEADVATLAERLTVEVIDNRSVVVGRSEVGAWTRLVTPADAVTSAAG